MKANTITAAYKKPNVLVSQQVKTTLPEPLIDYLCGLLITDTDIRGSNHVFGLSVNQINGREIQDIFHIGENKTAIHRVFGYKPFNAEITINCVENSYHMAMTNEKCDAA